MGFQINKLHDYQFIMADAAPNLDRFLHAIADPTRRRILSALKEKGGCSLDKKSGLCAFDIERRGELGPPPASAPLQILEEISVVARRGLAARVRHRRFCFVLAIRLHCRVPFPLSQHTDL